MSDGPGNPGRISKDGFETFFGWPDQWDGPWDCAIKFAPIAGRMEVVGLHIRHRDDSEPLTSTLLRQFKLRDVANEQRKAILSAVPDEGVSVDELVATYGEETREDWEQRKAGADARWREQLEKFKAPHPGFYPPEHYEWVAETYRTAFERGSPPVAAVQDQYERKHQVAITRAQARHWVERARKRRLLPPTEPRKPKA